MRVPGVQSTARTLGPHDRPPVTLGPWGLYEPPQALVTGMHEAGFTRPDVFDAISWTTTVEEAFRLLEKRTTHLVPGPEELGETTAG